MTLIKALLGLVTAACALGSCRPAVDDESSGNGVASVALNERTPTIPEVDPPLDRAALLFAAARAASAAALGQDDTEAQKELRGDIFEVRIRFGCPSDTTRISVGPFGLGFDEKTGTLRVRAKPDVSEAEPWVRTVAGETVEAVEGFRMNRPWLLDAACPISRSVPGRKVADAGISAAGERNQWVGIAQFFTGADSRTGQLDHRAYEATKNLGDGVKPSTKGYDLVLAGRLRQLPSGRIIACNAHDSQQPADCVISAKFDKVRIERGDNREVLAEWAAN